MSEIKIKWFKNPEGAHNRFFGSSVLYQAPTGDCQTFSVSYFGSLSKHKDIREILIELCRITMKKQLLVNVVNGSSSKYQESIDTLCKNPGSIIVRQEYTSTRNSNMVLYLINLYKVLEVTNYDDIIKLDSLKIMPYEI